MSCTPEIIATPIEGYSHDLLTCAVCGYGEVTHRGIRQPCVDCEMAGSESDRDVIRRAHHRDCDRPGFTLVGFMACPAHWVRQRRAQYESGWGFSDEWYRHEPCGYISPRHRFPFRNRAGVEAPPFCPDCNGPDWEPDERRIKADARDLLYLVAFPGFVKLGRTLEPGWRLRGHVALGGSRLIQVVSGRHDQVAAAEAAIKKEFASYLLAEPHAYMRHFGMTETFRPDVRRRIGDLRSWVGRGARDRTSDFSPQK